jgi:membrane protein implicated in regulation of membrane protease activity
MLVLALGLAALLVIGILLAPLGAGIVAVVTVLALAVVGWALWGLFWGRSRSRARPQPEHPEFLGSGGPDDPDRSEPVTDVETEETVTTSRR